MQTVAMARGWMGECDFLFSGRLCANKRLELLPRFTKSGRDDPLAGRHDRRHPERKARGGSDWPPGYALPTLEHTR